MALFSIVTVLVYTGTKSEKYWSFPFLQIQLSRFFDLALNKEFAEFDANICWWKCTETLCINLD